MMGAGVNVFAERARLVEALLTGEGLEPLVRRMAGGSLLCALGYGAVLGAQVGGWQVVSGPVKFPMILLGTCALCIGALYVMLALAGVRFRWLQVVGLALAAVSASGITMAALLPIAAFWTFVFQGNRELITLVHAGAFILAGTIGTRFGLEISAALFPARKTVRVVVVWMWIYGLVAQQMAWLFRPHFHPTDVFMRPLSSGGSALEALFRLLMDRLS
jgi:hypothetical protein